MIARLLGEKKASNCRPRTLEDLRSRWGKFAEWFGDRPLSEITTEEFTDWLNKVGTSPVNRHNYRRKIKELYRAAIRRKWAIENIVEATDRVLLDETTPGILTVGEAPRCSNMRPITRCCLIVCSDCTAASARMNCKSCDGKTSTSLSAPLRLTPRLPRNVANASSL